MPRYAELIYNGFWFSPEREMLQALIDKSQEFVTGKVRLKLYKGSASVVSREIPVFALQPGPRDLRGGRGRLRSARCRRVHQAQRAAASSGRSALAADERQIASHYSISPGTGQPSRPLSRQSRAGFHPNGEQFMRVFSCGHCGQNVYFENVICENCGTALGFDPQKLAMRPLYPDNSGTLVTRGSGAAPGSIARTTPIRSAIGWCLFAARRRALPELRPEPHHPRSLGSGQCREMVRGREGEAPAHLHAAEARNFRSPRTRTAPPRRRSASTFSPTP